MLFVILFSFILGYVLIVLEQPLKIDKAVSGILTGVICWVLVSMAPGLVESGMTPESEIGHHLGEIAQILLFLIGAMTIVELVDAHKGFNLLSDLIQTKKKASLLIVVSIITFFLSAVLDNLTTTIVMISLIRKLVPDQESRKWYAGFIIIAANAGGAWSPLGDVTTTMLWIGEKVSSMELVKLVFIPSILCLAVPLALAILFTNHFKGPVIAQEKDHDHVLGSSRFMLITGILALLSVPVFKLLTHLPPFMGMMLALSVVWLISEFVDPKMDNFHVEDRHKLTARYALSRIEIPGILFFFGILTAVAALQSVGLLTVLATGLDAILGNYNYVAIMLGVLSSIIDNVPLVAASMGMYSLPEDHGFWHFIAYAAGTGGSMLIIGSAAGVAAMGMENLQFMWYLKRIGGLAAVGFLAGSLWMLLVGA